MSEQNNTKSQGLSDFDQYFFQKGLSEGNVFLPNGQQVESTPAEEGQGFGGDVVDSIQYGLAQAGGGLAETGYQLTKIEALADARDVSNEWGKSQLEEMSTEGREAMTAQIFEETAPDFEGNTSLRLGDGATNWKTWALQLSSLAGQMVPQIALGGGFASLGAKVAGKVVMKTAAKKALASGATKEASILAGKKAAEAAFATARSGAGVVGYAAVGTAIAGGMIGNEVRDEVMEMTNEQLDQSNEYRKLYYQINEMQPELDVEAVRDLTKRTLADRTATTVQQDPMLITSNLLMEAVGGKFLDDIFRGVGSGSRSINAGKQFAVQGSTEAAQGGIEKYASNTAIIDEGVDPNRDAFEGVKGAAANEGILGGALGGGMGALRKGEPLPQHEPLLTDNAEDLSEAGMNNTAEAAQPENSAQTQPEMTLDEAVEQIKTDRSEYRGIDDDIAIAQKQGFDEEAVRLRAAKRNFEMAQDLMNEGDRESAMRFRERGLKIYRDVMEPNSPDNHESSNLFPAEYVATGDYLQKEQQPPVYPVKEGETIDAPVNAIENKMDASVIYNGRDTSEIDAAKAKTDTAFTGQHKPKTVVGTEIEVEQVESDPVIPMLGLDEDAPLPASDNTVYAGRDNTERDAAKAKTEAAFTQQQGKEPGAFNYDEVQQDKDQAVNRLTEIIADIKKTNVQDVNIKGERGRKGRVKIGDNYQPVTFKLVDMDANPALKPTISRSENQFRDRNRAASDTQIASIAAKLDFNELGESPRMTSGAPTLSREGRVIGGNGRMAAIRKAYAGKAADNYKAELKKRAKEFGINPTSIDKMKSPVLIRQFDNPVDIAKTAIESNNSGTMDMSALEQAAADNTLLPNVPNLEMDDAGNINWNNEGNRRSIRGFISALPQASQNSLLKSDGTISPAGIRRFENLLTYKAFGQNQVLDNLIENAKEESSQNIKNVLQSLAPHIAMVRQGMKRGDYHHIDITDHLVEAIELLESLRASSRSVSDYMAQLDMVSVTDPVTNAIAQELEENVRSPKVLREQIKGYYDSIVAAGNPDQSDMFGTKSISLTDLVGLNNDETNTLERDAGQDGLGSERAPTPQEAQPSNDSGRAATEPTASEPDASAEEELLTTYSEEDIATLEAKNKAASDAKAKAEQQSDQKAKADIEANDFKLSGSDRTADIAAAEGQNSLFDTAAKVDQAASEAATSKNNDTPEPTEAQQEAGNYKKGHVTIQGLDIAIENERGSERKGTDPDGNEWSVKMAHHYGYIRSFNPSSPAEFQDSTITAIKNLSDVSIAHPLFSQSGNSGDVVSILKSSVRNLVSSVRQNLTHAGLRNSEEATDISPTNPLVKQINSLVNIPANKASSIKPFIFKAARDGLMIDSHLFGNTSEASAIRSHGFDSLDVNRSKMVKRHMLTALNNFKVFESVIKLVPIDVMNMVPGWDVSRGGISNNQSMLLDAFSSPLENSVFIGRFIDSVASGHPVALASLIAEKISTTGKSARGSNNIDSTIGASSDRHNKNPDKTIKNKYYTAKGADGDHVGVFIGKNPDSEKVFIVDQVNPDGTFDEHKVMLGFNNKAMAITGYKSSYEKGWKVGPIKSMTMAEFKDWLKSGDTKKPSATLIDDGTKTVENSESNIDVSQESSVLENGKSNTQSNQSTNDQEQKPAATAIKDEKQPESKESVKKKTVEKLDDAGEVLWGARKHIAAAYEKSFSDKDIESLPLSKIWPKKDIDDIDNHYIAALATVAREQIPSKPRKSYKLNRWVASVQMYRGLVSDVVKSPKLDVLNKSLSDAADKSQQSANFFNKMQLLSKLDRKDWPRIGSVAINASAQVARDGGYVNQPFALIETDGVRKIFHDVVDVPSLLPKVKELLNKDVKAKTKKMAFEIRGRAGNFFINKKGDKAYRKLIEFDDLKEARDFKNNQNEKLVELWEAVKAQENVNKADVRPKEALPRTGKDHREGKDITAEEFKDAFGFRGVQFGNWVKQGSGKNDRQGFVNQAYDAFMDLSEIIGVPPMALSLNGDLGIAFGARGKSKAMAHFEPNTNVINLTKMSGAGTLAHEWFHALDNYFHKQRGEFSNDLEPFLTYAPESHYTDGTHRIRADVYESESFKKNNKNLNWEKAKTGLRNEIADAFTNLVKVLKASNMQQRARKIDQGKSGKDYWGTAIEVAARSFENYAVKKMNDAGYNNGFLAQFTLIEDYKLADTTYPYHLPSEMESIEKAFDDVFSVIEVKKEKGKQVLFKLTDNDALASKIKEMRESLRRNEDDPDSTSETNKPTTELAFSSVDDVKAWIAETEKLLGKKVNVVGSKMDLPIAVKFRVGVANFGKDFDAIYDQETGETWINANQIVDKEHAIKTVLHETLGHGGVIDFLNTQEQKGGKEVTDALEDIYRKAGKKLINRDIERYGFDYSDKKQRQTAVLEYIAHLAETGKKANWMHKVIGAIKNAMRKIFPNIAWTDLDTLLLLEKGRRHLRENGNDGQGGESLASLAKSEAEEFRTNLGRTLKSKRTRVGSIVVSKTPEILKQLGVSGNNITIERDTVRKATNGIKHDVSMETIEHLPELLADPVMVFDSKKPGSMVVVIDAKDESGRSVMTALQIDSLDKGIKVNRIGSVYGRESNEHYSKWIKEGLLRYIDKDKSSDLVRYEGLQLPRNGSLDQNSSTRVLTKADVVNSSNDALMRMSNTAEVDDTPNKQAKEATKKGFETLAEDGSDYKSRASHIIRVMADKFKPLKDIQENIKKSGAEISEGADAYLAEELFHGKAENDIRTLRETYIEPLANKMAAFGITHAKLDEYLYAKHAPERNEQIAKINPDLPDGGSGMTTELANSIVKEVESSSKAGQYEQLSNIIYSMLSAQREALIDGGLMDGDVIDSWSNSYKYYVPLKGLANDEKAAGFSNTGKGFNISGKESKRALGRKTKAESPISHAIKDTTEKLIRKRKNEVGNAFLNLVEQNPNKEFWQIFTDENPDTSRSVTKSKDPKTGEVVETVKETAIPMAILKDQYFVTKRDGKSYYIKVSDPRLMKAMKNIGPETSNPVLRTLAGVNRYLSAINTSYSPEFTISNFARDMQTALLNLNAEQSRDDGKIKGEGIVKQTLKDVPKAMNAVYRSLRGKSAKNKEWAEWFDEFREAGAKTGYFDMKDIDGQSKELEVLTSIAEGGFKGGFYKWTKATAKLVEDANQSIENAVRLSAYANARKAGISKAKAASLAKNMTVNFNRRGEAGTTLNSLYMFANASIQGTLNFARTMGGFKGEKGDPVWSRLNSAQKISVGIMAGAYTLALMNRMGAGEDDDGENYWDKVPSYIKERNIVIMKSLLGGDQDGTYWKIPAPYGYNIFNILGTSAESVAAGNSVGQAASDVTLGFLGSFSPIGFSESDSVTGTILKNAMPTIGKPFLDVGMNENFFGGTIYSENFPFGTPKPDSSLGRLSTPEGYKAIASFMNEVTGGSEYRAGLVDVNPDVMRYFISYLTGGAGNFAFNKLPDTAYRLTNDLDIESNKVPFLSKVNGKVTPYQDRSEFYDRRDEIGQIMEEYQSLSGDEKQEFRKEYGSKIRLKGMVKGIEKSLSSLRKQRTRILSQDLSPADEEAKLKLIDERIKKLIDRFNKAYGRA